jgi:hypothetical protein
MSAPMPNDKNKKPLLVLLRFVAAVLFLTTAVLQWFDNGPTWRVALFVVAGIFFLVAGIMDLRQGRRK